MPPKHRLLTGSFRALEPGFLEAVEARLRARPLEPLEVLSGSNLLSVYLRRRVAERLGAVVNLRFVTFLDLAREMAPGADPRPTLPALGPARLAGRALRETPEAEAFGALRGRPSLAAALLSTRADLREAGVPGPWREVLPRAAAFPDRRVLLAAVGATLDRLAALASGFADDDALLERAAEGTASTEEPLLVYGLWDLGGARAKLLARIARTRPVVAFIPRSADAEETKDDETARGAPLFAHLLGAVPESLAESAPDAAIAAVLAPSDAAEAREVVRELLRAVERGTPLHRCAILLRHPLRQEPAIVAELRLRGLPFFRPAGVGFARTPVARAAIALASLAADDAPRESFDALADLLDSLGRLPGGLPTAQLSALLTRGAWFGGKKDLRARLARLRDPRPGHADAARRFCTSLLDALPADSPAGWEELAARLETLFSAFLGTSARELSPALDALAALAAVEPGAAVPLADAAALLPEALDLSPVSHGRFEKDGVSLLSHVSARGLLFDEVLVPGLCEGSFPAPPRPDPLLFDKERETLREKTGAPLPARSGPRHLAGERFLFAVARGAARKRFVALAPTRDENDREKLPSSFFLGLPPAQGASTEELKDRTAAAARGIRRVPLGILVGDPVAIDADEAFRVALFRRASLARSPLAPAALGPALRRASLRRRPLFSEYEGRLGRRTDRLALSDRFLSATLLEQLATCPYRTLLEKGLHLEELKEPVSPLVPDARALGAMAHEVLRDLTRELIEHGRSFTWQPDALDSRADVLVKEVVARWVDESGADPPPPLTERTARHLFRLVREVLRHERKQGSRPAGAEVRFGRKRDGAADPDLSRDEAVTLEADGRVFFLEGQIDRIDREGETALVVDYKLGKSKPYEKANRAGHLVAQGERLQLPVYALAARAMGAAEISSAYVFVPTGDEALRIPFDAARTAEAIEGLEKAVGALARAVEQGDFLPKPDGVRSGKGGNCKYCAMADVCGGGHLVVFERKWEADAGSTPLSELKEIR